MEREKNNSSVLCDVFAHCGRKECSLEQCNGWDNNNMNYEKITVKQLSWLLMNCGFRKCELWTEKAYINVHHTTKAFRAHRISTKKMDLLHDEGLSHKDAQRWVIMEGKQKVNKRNLSLLGTPIWTGSLEELSNKQNLWNLSVCNCYIKGFHRNKIQIIIEDDV